MDISINSGKYAKKDDINTLVKVLKEQAEIIDDNMSLVDKKIKFLYSYMTDVIGDLIDGYQSFNESWIEKALDERQKATYKEESKKFKENLMKKLTSTGREMVSESGIKIE